MSAQFQLSRLMRLTCAVCVGLSWLIVGVGAVHAAPGVLDPLFGNVGVRYPAGTLPQSSPVQRLAVAGDGTTYIAGDCNLQFSAAVCIRKFNANGALDTAFGVGGYRALVVGEYTFLGVLGIALAPSSAHFTVAGTCAITTKLTGGGAATVGTCIVRFGATGNVVTHFFGGTEDVYFDSNSATAFAQLPSGVLALAGYCATGDSTFCTRMVSETGQPLNSLVSVASPGNYAYVRVIAPKNDGGLWFFNSCKEGSAYAACLVKLLAYNDIDSAFGSNGTLLLAEPTTLTPALIAVTAATVQPDGKLLIAGSCRSNGAYRCVKRYLPDGSVDTTWAATSATPHTLLFGNPNEFSVLPVSSNEDSLIVLGDGKVVYGTGLLLPMLLPNGQPQRSDVVVHRFNNDGTTDTKFGASGSGRVRIGSWDSGGAQINSALNALAVTRDDALMVLGSRLPATPVGSVIQPCLAKLGGGPLDYARCSADIDGDGVIASATDSALLARVALGFKDAALVQGLTFSLSANRTSWLAIRDYLFNQCGMAVQS